MNRILDKLWTFGKGRTLIAGHFYPAGTAAPTTDSDSNLGYSAQRTATGVYTVTMEDTFPTLVSEYASLRLNSPGTGNPWEARIQSVNLTTKVATINIYSNGTLTDPAAHANNRVSFGFLFKNSTVGG